MARIDSLSGGGARLSGGGTRSGDAWVLSPRWALMQGGLFFILVARPPAIGKIYAQSMERHLNQGLSGKGRDNQRSKQDEKAEQEGRRPNGTGVKVSSVD